MNTSNTAELLACYCYDNAYYVGNSAPIVAGILLLAIKKYVVILGVNQLLLSASFFN